MNTFLKKKNVFKIEKFDEFLEYPNEYVDLQLEMDNIKEELKNIDKEIYQKIMKDCEEQEVLEEINDNLYRNKSDKAQKSQFINKVWKHVFKNYKSVIEDYEKDNFQRILNRISIILKGKVMEKIQEFY